MKQKQKDFFSGKDGSNWKKKLKQDTGIDINASPLVEWSWEKLSTIFTTCWWEILETAKKENWKVENLVAITGKDTRKTTIWLIFLWFIMNEYPYINGFVLRDTLVKSKDQMSKQIRKTATFIEYEYKVKGFLDNVMEKNNSFWYVRDKSSKANQQIDLMSFNSIIEVGGFTTNNGNSAIFIYDELQNPNSKNKALITQKQFLANYKFLAEKNSEIESAMEVSQGIKPLPKWIPRHIFLSNRYIGAHPLNIFAETHFPFYDTFEKDTTITGVKSWMLENPIIHNFIWKYIPKEETTKEWKDFGNTIIVYASKLSNEIMKKSKEWPEKEQEILEKIENGDEDDLARIIGDLFEGYENLEKAQNYTRKETITRETFIKEYAPYVKSVRIACDIDISRQLVFGAFYECEKIVNGERVFRLIRDRKDVVLCNGADKTGARVRAYKQLLNTKLEKYCIDIIKQMPQIKNVLLLFDDNGSTWAETFNFGIHQNAFWQAHKVDFKKQFKRTIRMTEIDTMQDTGFIVDIEHQTLKNLHNIYNNSIIKVENEKGDKKRLELSGDKDIDWINQDEYGIYFSIAKRRMNDVATRQLENKGVKNEWK